MINDLYIDFTLNQYRAMIEVDGLAVLGILSAVVGH
jgi:hypothetical protein